MISERQHQTLTLDTVPTDATFLYSSKCFCCCSKMITIVFSLSDKDLLFYKNFSKTNLLLSIPKSSVIAINKRQIDKSDLYKFSIYYQTSNPNKIKEIKLKAKNNKDLHNWISNLRRELQPKKYHFASKGKDYEEATVLFPIKDTRKFYMALCHLEFILLRGNFSKFFDLYKKEINRPIDRTISQIASKSEITEQSNIFLEMSKIEKKTNNILVSNEESRSMLLNNQNEINEKDIKIKID